MTLAVRRHAEAQRFLARAEPWLLGAEAEHNLLLGIARQLARGHGRYEAPIYLATIERDEEVVGCVFRTPPYKLGLTRMPAEAVSLAVQDVAHVYDEVPAVLGPEAETLAFAEHWSRLRGVRAVPGMRQRIYQLEQVTLPEPLPSGAFRVATERDAATVTDWIEAFRTEAGVAEVQARKLTEERIAEGVIFLWDDGGPVSLAGWSGRSPNGVRIGPVYTPPELRGKGYASAVTAIASQRALERGMRYCFLYTDLANPTSNSIYQRIGYSPVADVLDIGFQ